MNLKTTLKLILIGFILCAAFLGFRNVTDGSVVNVHQKGIKLVDKKFTQKNFPYLLGFHHMPSRFEGFFFFFFSKNTIF